MMQKVCVCACVCVIWFLDEVSLNCPGSPQTLIPPASTSQKTEITGICYHSQLGAENFNLSVHYCILQVQKSNL